MVDLVIDETPPIARRALRTLFGQRDRIGALPFRVAQRIVRSLVPHGSQEALQFGFGPSVRLVGGGTLRIRGRVLLREGSRLEIERGFVSMDSRVHIGAWVSIIALDPESFVRIASDVYVGPYSYLDGRRGLSIGRHTAIGPHCAIIAESLGMNSTTPRAQQPQAGREIVIGENVWIGAGAKVLSGTTIGDGAIVGAGAVVTNNVPARAVAVGVPARVVRMLVD